MTIRGASARGAARGWWRWCLAMLVVAMAGLAWLPGGVAGQAAPAAGGGVVAGSAGEKAKPVHVGVYVNAIKSIDLKTNTFSLDFWVWFRWAADAAPAGASAPPPATAPAETAFDPLETFEVINGVVDSKENIIRDLIETPQGKYHYAAARVVATVTKFFDISRFPLDAHTLTLNIEDAEREELRLVYVPDKENTGLSPDVKVPGWDIRGTQTRLASNEYATNYGNISLPTGNASVYSRFSYDIELARPGMGYFFKLFWSLFLATVIALLAFMIDPIDLDPRFGLGVGAIFAAIASAYVISSTLPETNQYTLADRMNMLAVGVIFMTILQSVVSLRIWKSGREGASKKFDKACFYTMLPGYGVAASVISLL